MQFLTFKLSFNDYYAQDISNKIKSVKSRKIEKGEFQGGIAPYGYKKDDKIKNHLIIDEYAAEIVKDIFGEGKIGKRLNPDEAVSIGLGWCGALRSKKYHIPYTIEIIDKITVL